MCCIGVHRARDIGHLHRRNFFHINLAALHVLKSVPDEIHALLQGDHETGHASVGHWQRALALLGNKERNDRAARAHHVAVAHHREPTTVCTCVRIARHKQFVRSELGGAVQIRWAAGLVGGQGHHALDFVIDARIDQIHRANDVGLHTFERVVFGSGYDFGGRCVHHIVHPVKRAVHALAVAHIADEKAHPFVTLEQLGHLPLLHLVARVDDDFAQVVARQCHGYKGVAKRAGATGDQQGGVFQHGGGAQCVGGSNQSTILADPAQAKSDCGGLFPPLFYRFSDCFVDRWRPAWRWAKGFYLALFWRFSGAFAVLFWRAIAKRCCLALLLHVVVWRYHLPFKRAALPAVIASGFHEAAACATG